MFCKVGTNPSIISICLASNFLCFFCFFHPDPGMNIYFVFKICHTVTLTSSVFLSLSITVCKICKKLWSIFVKIVFFAQGIPIMFQNILQKLSSKMSFTHSMDIFLEKAAQSYTAPKHADEYCSNKQGSHILAWFFSKISLRETKISLGQPSIQHKQVLASSLS